MIVARARSVLLLPVLVALLVSSSYGGPRRHVSPALAAYLSAPTAPARVRVILRLRAPRPDPAAPRASLTASSDLLALRRAQADAAARPLLEFLASRAQPGPWAASATASPAVTRLWVANSLIFETTPDTLQAILARDDVEAIIPDRRVRLLRPLAARPEATSAADVPWYLAKMNVPAVHADGIDGTGVTVGQIDSGVDPAHRMLAGQVAAFRDFVSMRADAYDDHWHGTHTAALIAGKPVRAVQGMIGGAAPGARLVVAKALDGQGDGELSTLLRAMQWMVEEGHPRPFVVSNSWGILRKDMRESGVEDTLFWDAVRAWREAGMIPMFSVGNDGADVDTVPATYPMAMAIGATDARDGVVSFSGGGVFEWTGLRFLKPDLCAPGEDIVSATPGNRTRSADGTSMACPLAAGAAALARHANPKLTARDVERLLIETARRGPGLSTRSTRGGEGYVDARALVMAARAFTGPRPEPPGGYLPHRADERQNPHAQVPGPRVPRLVTTLSIGLLALLAGLVVFVRF